MSRSWQSSSEHGTWHLTGNSRETPRPQTHQLSWLVVGVTLAKTTAAALYGRLGGEQDRVPACASARTDHHVPGKVTWPHVTHRDACRRAADDEGAKYERHLGSGLLPGVPIAERHRKVSGFNAALQDQRRPAGGADESR
jgi:hypothetical protein